MRIRTSSLGSTRIVQKFAWLPVQVGEYKIWLGSYREHQVYVKTHDLGYFNDIQGAWYGNYANVWLETQRSAVIDGVEVSSAVPTYYSLVK